MTLLLFRIFLSLARRSSLIFVVRTFNDGNHTTFTTVSFLNIRRRRWLLKKHNEYISRNWRMVAEGTRMTQDFASFLKELY